MQPTYTNSKNEQVVIADMPTRHLLYAICKLSRSLGDPELDTFSQDQKKNEVKSMHEELERRTIVHEYLMKLTQAIVEYDSDTFNAANSEVTISEAESIATRYFAAMVGGLVEYQTVELVSDGVRLGEMLDEIRQND